jgi:hypothetical protein
VKSIPRSDLVGWCALAAACIVAIATAARAKAPAPAAQADERVRKDAFRVVAYDEPPTRGKSTHAFPGDAWSQDDDYHAQEAKKIRSFAGEHEVRLDDVVRAVDEGMKEGWPPRGLMKTGVPPCRPRLDY